MPKASKNAPSSPSTRLQAKIDRKKATARRAEGRAASKALHDGGEEEKPKRKWAPVTFEYVVFFSLVSLADLHSGGQMRITSMRQMHC